MSNLLEKASILTTPTAYDDGKILSVKPNTSVGDFDFTRNSSATRVNAQGLVEDVQILSSNLVQNGDFSQEGSELVTNGDFATDSDWSLGTGWSIGVDKLVGSNADTSTYQGVGIQVNKSYKIQFTVIDYVSGSVRPLLNGLPNVDGTNVNSNGTYTQYLQSNSGSNGNFTIRGNSFVGSIDNVSVKEVGQDWTLGASWSIGNNKATRLTSVDWGLDQTISSAVNGRTYRVTTEITDYTSGELRLALGFGGTVNVIGNALGVYVNEFVWNGSSGSYIRFQGNFVGSISNITILEITEDTNLPRIDYTDGVGSWLFEPQSTNLYLYSEPTTNEGSTGGVTYESFNWTIGFTNCVKYGDNSAVRYRYGGTVLASTEYTLSAFVIMDDLSEPIIGGRTSDKDFTLVLGGSDVNPNSSVNMGNNIWRVSSTAITSASPNVGNSGILKVTTQSSKGFRVVGYQLEESSFATSYIPTNGSTVTRLQDAAFGAGNSSLINSTEGVLYFEAKTLVNGETNSNIVLSDGTNNNLIMLRFGVTANRVTAFARGSGGSYSVLTINGVTQTDDNKFALVWDSSNFRVWVNGTERSTTTINSIPSGMNSLNFTSSSGGDFFFGKTKCVAVFKEALTDAELTCLTTI